MASRAELIEMAKEIDAEYEGLTIEELKESVKKKADELFSGRAGYHTSADKLSYTLKKFLTREYNFVIKDKNGNVIEF